MHNIRTSTRKYFVNQFVRVRIIVEEMCFDGWMAGKKDLEEIPRAEREDFLHSFPPVLRKRFLLFLTLAKLYVSPAVVHACPRASGAKQFNQEESGRKRTLSSSYMADNDRFGPFYYCNQRTFICSGRLFYMREAEVVLEREDARTHTHAS